MVLAAVREDRMPGGRNSGAVYNLYKVKYRSRKRKNGSSSKGSSRDSDVEKSAPPSPAPHNRPAPYPLEPSSTEPGLCLFNQRDLKYAVTVIL